MIPAGKKTNDKTMAVRTPKAVKIPKYLTGKTCDVRSEIKPTAVVMDVIITGFHKWLIISFVASNFEALGL